MRKSVVFIFLLIFLFFCESTLAAGDSGVVYLLPVEGDIDPGLVAFIERGIQEAEKGGADLLILEIDTYGGLVDSGIKIRDLILEAEVPVITYVEGRAWSAGALVALAGEKLIMKAGSSMGAAETRPLEEKYISALRKEFKATAELRGKNPDLAAAMVDVDLEIEGIVEKGKLLTLTADEARQYGMADYKVNNLGELYAKIDFTALREIMLKPTLLEKLARYVTNPVVSGVLLSIVFLAFILEIFTAGWGVGGTIALLTLGFFFSAYIITNLASWGLLILFLVGLILLALEAFVVPGFGITGIGGLVAILASLYFLFPTPEIALGVLASVLVVTTLGMAVIIKIFGTSRFWKRISLGESQTTEAGYLATKAKKDFLGKIGLTVTPLRPAGIIELAGERLDVVSEGAFIGSGQKVKVIKIEGSRIVVKAIAEEE